MADATPIRQIKIFISSSGDVKGERETERDWLNRVVFPELRSRCRRQGA